VPQCMSLWVGCQLFTSEGVFVQLLQVSVLLRGGGCREHFTASGVERTVAKCCDASLWLLMKCHAETLLVLFGCETRALALMGGDEPRVYRT
jgi:hypothetical protein